MERGGKGTLACIGWVQIKLQLQRDLPKCRGLNKIRVCFSLTWVIDGECPRAAGIKGRGSSDTRGYPVTQGDGFAVILNMEAPSLVQGSCPRCCHFWARRKWRNGAQGRQVCLVGMAWNLLEMGTALTLLPLTLHWPELSHMITHLQGKLGNVVSSWAAMCSTLGSNAWRSEVELM